MIEAVVYRIFRKVSEHAGEDFADKYLVSFLQFLRFGIVGLSNTVAQGIAFVISVVWSFYWNNRIVFTLQDGEKRSILKTFVKTFVSYSFTGLILNSALLILWVRILHISEFVAPIINLLVSVPLNFLINKFWAFK